jgi:hypothetical protein
MVRTLPYKGIDMACCFGCRVFVTREDMGNSLYCRECITGPEAASQYLENNRRARWGRRERIDKVLMLGTAVLVCIAILGAMEWVCRLTAKGGF